MPIELYIFGNTQVDLSRSPIVETANPDRFSNEIYVHNGHMVFEYSGLEPETDYNIIIGFAELYYNQIGKRLQDVYINDIKVLEDFDIFKEANGMYRGIEKKLNGKSDSNGYMIVMFRKKNIGACSDICNITVKKENKITIDFVAGNKHIQIKTNENLIKKSVNFTRCQIK